MKRLTVLLETELLCATNKTAERLKMTRSALIRQALQEHLMRLPISDLEARDRRGYEAQPQRVGEFRPWEEAAAWPEE